MLLDGILEHNRGFVRGRTVSPLPPPETLRLAVVACYDPRLDAILPAALGISPQKTFFLRAAGTVVRAEGDPLRSLALAVYMFGVNEILVVGHTSCRMAAFENTSFIEAFRARGVRREAFGPTDLREWAGAIPDPRRGVQASVAAIASAPFLPGDLTLAGLVLDDASGALEVVVQPGARIASSPMPSTEPEPAHATPPPLAAPAPAPAPAELPPAMQHEADAVRAFISSLESSAWRDELQRMREELEASRSPVARLILVEKFLKRSAGNAREVAAAFERLKTETGAAGRASEVERVIDLFRRRRTS